MDFGCAKGFYVTLFNQFGYFAQGVDISSFAISGCIEETQSNLHVLDNLNLLTYLKHQNFDLVIVKDVLEHIPAKILPRFLGNYKKNREKDISRSTYLHK